jgi:hypothetical protein
MTYVNAIYCGDIMYSSISQLQTCLTIHMDDLTGKHSVKGLRIDAQRMTANIHAREMEKLLISCVFFLLPATEDYGRLI